jgi:hypothetical protein
VFAISLSFPLEAFLYLQLNRKMFFGGGFPGGFPGGPGGGMGGGKREPVDNESYYKTLVSSVSSAPVTCFEWLPRFLDGVFYVDKNEFNSTLKQVFEASRTNELRTGCPKVCFSR